MCNDEPIQCPRPADLKSSSCADPQPQVLIVTIDEIRNLQNLAFSVALMRLRQREYFRTKDKIKKQAILSQCLPLEVEVDGLLKKISILGFQG